MYIVHDDVCTNSCMVLMNSGSCIISLWVYSRIKSHLACFTYCVLLHGMVNTVDMVYLAVIVI